MTTQPNDDWITIRQMAALLGVCYSTAYKLARTRGLGLREHVDITGARCWLVSRVDVRQLAAERLLRAAAPRRGRGRPTIVPPNPPSIP